MESSFISIVFLTSSSPGVFTYIFSSFESLFSSLSFEKNFLLSSVLLLSIFKHGGANKFPELVACIILISLLLLITRFSLLNIVKLLLSYLFSIIFIENLDMANFSKLNVLISDSF